MDKLVNLQFQEKRALIASSFKSEMICNQLKADPPPPLYLAKSDASTAGSELAGGGGSVVGLKNEPGGAATTTHLSALRNTWRENAVLKIVAVCSRGGSWNDAILVFELSKLSVGRIKGTGQWRRLLD
jgi:hypothetical protein